MFSLIRKALTGICNFFKGLFGGSNKEQPTSPALESVRAIVREEVAKVKEERKKLTLTRNFERPVKAVTVAVEAPVQQPKQPELQPEANLPRKAIEPRYEAPVNRDMFAGVPRTIVNGQVCLEIPSPYGKARAQHVETQPVYEPTGKFLTSKGLVPETTVGQNRAMSRSAPVKVPGTVGQYRFPPGDPRNKYPMY